MLKIGIIIKQSALPHHVWQLLQLSTNSGHYTPSCLIVLKERNNKPTLATKLLNWITHIEKKWLKGAGLGHHLTEHSLDQISIKTIDIIANDTKNISTHDLKKIAECQLDLLVQIDANNASGTFIPICPMGFLSLDISPHMGFWDVLQKQPVSVFTIKKHHKDAKPCTLYSGNISTSALFLINHKKLLTKATTTMHHFLEQTGKKKRLPEPSGHPPHTPMHLKPPGIFAVLSYMLHTTIHLLKGSLATRRKLTHRYHVGYQFTENWQQADLGVNQSIPNPKGHFLADPFTVKYKDKHYCFVEDLDYKTHKGSINVYEITSAGAQHIGVALDEPFHLSFPYVFQVNNTWYMCPETNQANDIRIYRCTDFPLKWTLHKILMKNVCAADTLLFAHQDKWWMLTNIDTSGLGDYCSELHVFYADQFDATYWHPLPQNPVIFDATCARNAGLIIEKGNLFRSFQTQGFDFYGKSMGIAKIETLSTSHYHETPIRQINPNFNKDVTGTHTFNHQDGLLVFDYNVFENHLT